MPQVQLPVHWFEYKLFLLHIPHRVMGALGESFIILGAQILHHHLARVGKTPNQFVSCVFVQVQYSSTLILK